jgi:hypothetical protein
VTAAGRVNVLTARDDLRKAILWEFLPLGVSVALVAPLTVFWLVPEFLRYLIGAMELVLSPLLVIGGFGWMGRGHDVIGAVVLLIRLCLLVLVLAFGWAAGLSGATRGDAVTFFVFFGAWMALPAVSAGILATVPARA